MIDGCPAGLPLSVDEIQYELYRRRPGQSSVTTSRTEEDRVEILSGVFEGVTTGTPIGFVVRNKDQRSRASGAKGKRIALPNAEVMIHQPSAGTQGKVTDMEIDVEHFLKIKQRMNKILSENTGKTPEQVKLDSERDNWMTAEEARDYGLVDKVIFKR